MGEHEVLTSNTGADIGTEASQFEQVLRIGVLDILQGPCNKDPSFRGYKPKPYSKGAWDAVVEPGSCRRAPWQVVTSKLLMCCCHACMAREVTSNAEG